MARSKAHIQQVHSAKNASITDKYEVIIVGGSYSGLAAAMALGRSLRSTLIIDGGEPCNRYARHAQNLITRDGTPPAKIAAIAKKQVLAYPSVTFQKDIVIKAGRTAKGFSVTCQSGKTYKAGKLLFATGLKDNLPDIPGFSACWGKSIIHCPYCHGYELRAQVTGILANGEGALHYAQLLLNWTSSLCLFTDGPARLSEEGFAFLNRHKIPIYENPIEKFTATGGQLKSVVFKKQSETKQALTKGRPSVKKTTDAPAAGVSVDVLYTSPATSQQCQIPIALGCNLTAHGLLAVDDGGRTNITGIYAAGDNTHFRALAVAIANGLTTGANINFDLIQEAFPLVAKTKGVKSSTEK